MPKVLGQKHLVALVVKPIMQLTSQSLVLTGMADEHSRHRISPDQRWIARIEGWQL